MKKIYGKTACLEATGTNYCPGCGHGLIQKLCLEVIEEMGLMEKAVFAASVGCHGMAPVYVNIDAFNAQHGRIPSNAEAFKACSPESILLVYQGDGDAVSIGMNETVNTAYRGAPLTVIMANNSNFGMTGGQLAPTTLHGAVTKTTKNGNPYYPIRTAELVATLEAPDYVARCSVHDVKHALQFKKAVEHGLRCQMAGKYSFIEVLSNCPTSGGIKPENYKLYCEETLMKVFPLGEFKRDGVRL